MEWRVRDWEISLSAHAFPTAKPQDELALIIPSLDWQDETVTETRLLHASNISPQTTMGGVGHSMSRVPVYLELLASKTPVKYTPNSLNANPTPPSISTKVAIR